MTNSDQSPLPPSSDELIVSATPSEPQPSETDSALPPITRQQADQILVELKGIKQNIFWLLLVVSFFAARSIFFHY